MEFWDDLFCVTTGKEVTRCNYETTAAALSFKICRNEMKIINMLHYLVRVKEMSIQVRSSYSLALEV